MTVIRPNSVSGINSITAQANEIKIFKSDGTQGGLMIDGANLNATSGISTVAALTVTGNVSVGGTLTYQDVTNIDSVGVITARAGVKVPDNQKVFLGTDSDLEIYHDGSNARIKNTTGQLWLQSDNGIRFVDSDVNESTARFTDNGAVELYYDGTKKFETTSSGVTVTGTATATEGLVLDGQTGSGKGLRLDLAGSSDYVIQETTTDDVVQFGGTGASNFFVHNISSGNISIGTTTGTGNLNVAGTGDCALDLIADIDNNGSNQWPVINFRRHSATGTPVARIYQVESDGSLRFDNGGSERLRILSGGGLTFNGDSATANALDDYEEGTSTVSIQNITADTNEVYMTYTKIGSVVCIIGVITIVNKTSSSGSNGWFHLPFAPSAHNTSKPGCSIQMNTINTSVAYLGFYGNNTNCYFNTLSGGYQNGNSLGNGKIGFTATYTTH